MFRKKKENEEEGTEGGAVVRKTKSFKRIRGLLSAESRRKRRERRKAKKAGAAGSSTASSAPAADDQSTVYQVDVEDRSVMTSKSAAEDKKPYMLKVVLLLMDPETRRFELLQLEFDSMKALVSDVLAQIPLSVTEDALRGQHYTAICGRDGEAMTGEKLLANFCTGNDVLVAVPSSTTAKECARLAKPILSDDKVVSMLRSSGIDCKAWVEKKPKKKPVPAPEADVALPKASSASTTTLLVVFGVLAAILLQVFHLYISAPIKPGHVVSPGIWLTKCGILSLWPSCDNAHVTFSDGVVRMTNAEGATVWELEGGVCQDDEEKDCVAGLHVLEDSTLLIGGKKVTSGKVYLDGVDLAPWPFAEPPKVKLHKKTMH